MAVLVSCIGVKEELNTFIFDGNEEHIDEVEVSKKKIYITIYEYSYRSSPDITISMTIYDDCPLCNNIDSLKKDLRELGKASFSIFNGDECAIFIINKTEHGEYAIYVSYNDIEISFTRSEVEFNKFVNRFERYIDWLMNKKSQFEQEDSMGS